MSRLRIDDCRTGDAAAPRRRSVCGRLFPLFLSLLLLTAAVPAAAQDDGEAKFDALYVRMLDNPTDLDLMFAFAQAARLIGRHEAAIGTLERMLIFNPNLPRVRLELGDLYLRIGAPTVARGYFEEVLAAPDLPPAVRSRAEAYLATIDRTTARHLLTGSVFGGVRYQTNANSGPSGRDVRAGGFDAILNDRFTAQDDFNYFLSGALVHRYDMDTPDREIWESRALFYLSRQDELSGLDVALVELRTGPRLAFLPRHLDQDITVRPFVTGNVVTLDDSVLFKTGGAGAEFNWRAASDLDLAATYIVRRKLFEDSSSNPNVQPQSGVEQEVAFDLAWQVLGNVRLNAGVGLLSDSARQDFHSNRAYSGYLGAQFSYAGPFGSRTSRPWIFQMVAARTATHYEAPDPGVDPDATRRDMEWRLTLANTVPLSPRWGLELQIQRTVIDSNLPNFDTTNTSFLAGATFAF